MSRDEVYRLRELLELPLIFHAGGRPNRARWEQITGTNEMTSKVMCDQIRAAMISIKESGQ
jgi:hypothetical protein